MSSITLCFNTLLVGAFCLSEICRSLSARFTILLWTCLSMDTSRIFPRVLASLDRDHSRILSLSRLPNTTSASFARCRRKATTRAKVKVAKVVKANPAKVRVKATVKATETPWTEWTLSMITPVGTKWTTRQSRLPRNESRSSLRMLLKRQTIPAEDGEVFPLTVARKSSRLSQRRLIGARCFATS